MRVLTNQAEGTKIKGGAQRRIVITMDEEIFYRIRDRATAERRTLSNMMVGLMEHALKTEQEKP